MSVNVQLAAYTPYLPSSQKKKNWKKLQKIMIRMTKFLHYLESSGKFQKKNCLQDVYNCKKYIKVYRCI